jgi:hypothetical protein
MSTNAGPIECGLLQPDLDSAPPTGLRSRNHTAPSPRDLSRFAARATQSSEGIRRRKEDALDEILIGETARSLRRPPHGSALTKLEDQQSYATRELEVLHHERIEGETR